VTAEPQLTPPGFEPEPRRFRQVLGHFCTGVTVITALVDQAQPAGFACQSFAAVSLEPPLVLFCPSRRSATWPRIERAGHFCANVLTDGQRELSRRFGISAAAGADKCGKTVGEGGDEIGGGGGLRGFGDFGVAGIHALHRFDGGKIHSCFVERLGINVANLLTAGGNEQRKNRGAREPYARYSRPPRNRKHAPRVQAALSHQWEF